MLHHGAFLCNRRANYEAQLWGKVKFYLRGTLITLETKETRLKKQYNTTILIMNNKLFFFNS